MKNIDPNIVNRESLVSDLSSMIAIPSVNRFGAPFNSPPEAEMADFFEKRLQELGLETQSREVENGRRNVWGTLKGNGNGATILLAGHMDTVGVEGYDNPFHPKIEDGKIYGRGSCDMKAGLAANLELVRLIQCEGIQLEGDLIIAGVVDEEHAMIGSIDFGINGPNIDYAIVAEPSQLEICPAHKGQVLMTLRTKGISAHSSMPENGKNAIYHMAMLVQKLETYAASLKTRTPDSLCGTPSFSVGVIRGGGDACSVPDFCEVDIDRRTIPGENYESVRAELFEIVINLKQDIPDFDCEILEPFLNIPPLNTEQSSPILQAILKASEQVIGKSTIKPFPGSTDAPNFNCPTVICGAGNLEQCHSLNEYISIDEIEKAICITLQTVINLQEKI